MTDDAKEPAGAGAPAEAAGKASGELQAIKDDLKALRADLKALCEAAKSGSKESLDALKARIGETATRLKQQAEEKARKEFAERPLTTLGLTFLVGFFLGVFFRRR